MNDPFPGQVVCSPEVERENSILASYNFRVGDPAPREITVEEDIDPAPCEIPGVLGGFSITMAHPNITVVDPGMLERFIERKQTDHSDHLRAVRDDGVPSDASKLL